MSPKNSTSDPHCYPNSLQCVQIMLLIVFALLPVDDSYAWGPLGHKAICDASWRASDQELKRKLSDVANRMGYDTFAESCGWADHVRRQRRYTWLSPLHYVNVSRQSAHVESANCLKKQYPRPRCVITAIEYFSQRMAQRDLSVQARDEALLLVSHFIGDLHQPLHVSYQDDRGGTQRQLIFEGKLMSLHSLWDNDILYCGYRKQWRKLGKQLYRKYRSRKLPEMSVVDWANESLALTRSIYHDLPTRLPDDYCQQYHPIALERLGLAAKRLNHVLTAMPK